MIVWKFAYSKTLKRRVLIKLRIPSGAFIYIGGDGDNAKCRASEAIVLSIHDGKGNKLINKTAYAPLRSSVFKYTVGKKIYPDSFTFEPKQCAHGIHFYKNRIAAKDAGEVQ